MFSSIRNNFGAGTIQFKDVFDTNFLILNATFSYRTDNPAYLEADVLEITVPDLPIDRSAECGVVMRFVDRGQSYGYPYVSDGGTVLKSWIKNKNTICIEKITAFDDHTEMIIYIQSMYLQLNRGANASTGVKKRITSKPTSNYIYWGSSLFCVIYPRWVFLHLDYSSAAYAVRNEDWRCTFEGLPLDVKADAPIMMSSCYQTPLAGGVNVCHIEDGIWKLNKADRNDGFDNTGNYVFGFACLIRDNEIEPDVPGRLRIEENPIKGATYVQITDFELELVPSPAVAAVTGRTGQYSTPYCIVYPTTVPEGMPNFRSYFLGRVLNGSGLCIQLASMYLDDTQARTTIRFDNQTGGSNFVIEMYDTSATMALV